MVTGRPGDGSESRWFSYWLGRLILMVVESEGLVALRILVH